MIYNPELESKIETEINRLAMTKQGPLCYRFVMLGTLKLSLTELTIILFYPVDGTGPKYMLYRNATGDIINKSVDEFLSSAFE